MAKALISIDYIVDFVANEGKLTGAAGSGDFWSHCPSDRGKALIEATISSLLLMLMMNDAFHPESAPSHFIISKD